MKKLLAIVLSLLMLCGCALADETQTITISGLALDSDVISIALTPSVTLGMDENSISFFVEYEGQRYLSVIAALTDEEVLISFPDHADTVIAVPLTDLSLPTWITSLTVTDFTEESAEAALTTLSGIGTAFITGLQSVVDIALPEDLTNDFSVDFTLQGDQIGIVLVSFLKALPDDFKQTIESLSGISFSDLDDVDGTGVFDDSIAISCRFEMANGVPAFTLSFTANDISLALALDSDGFTATYDEYGDQMVLSLTCTENGYDFLCTMNVDGESVTLSFNIACATIDNNVTLDLSNRVLYSDPAITEYVAPILTGLVSDLTALSADPGTATIIGLLLPSDVLSLVAPEDPEVVDDYTTGVEDYANDDILNGDDDFASDPDEGETEVSLTTEVFEGDENGNVTIGFPEGITWCNESTLESSGYILLRDPDTWEFIGTLTFARYDEPGTNYYVESSEENGMFCYTANNSEYYLRLFLNREIPHSDVIAMLNSFSWTE